MKLPRVIAAFLAGGEIVVHRQVSADTIEVLTISPSDKRWLAAAKAAAHFAKSDKPLPDLTE